MSDECCNKKSCCPTPPSYRWAVRIPLAILAVVLGGVFFNFSCGLMNQPSDVSFLFGLVLVLAGFGAVIAIALRLVKALFRAL